MLSQAPPHHRPGQALRFLVQPASGIHTSKTPLCGYVAYDVLPRRTLCAALGCGATRQTSQQRVSHHPNDLCGHGSTSDTMAGMSGTSGAMRMADSAIRAFVRVNSNTVVISRGTSPGNSAAISLVLA